MERPNSLDDGLGLLRLNTTESGVSLDDEIQASTIEVCDNLPKLGAYVFLSLLELTIGEAKIEKIAKLQAEIASSGSGPVHATSPPVLGYDRSSVLQSDQLMHTYIFCTQVDQDRDSLLSILVRRVLCLAMRRPNDAFHVGDCHVRVPVSVVLPLQTCSMDILRSTISIAFWFCRHLCLVVLSVLVPQTSSPRRRQVLQRTRTPGCVFVPVSTCFLRSA